MCTRQLALSLLLACLFSRGTAAQTGPSSESGAWIPLGAAPVDQAGAGRRGYVLPVDNADVTPLGANRFVVHAVAANNFYQERTGSFLVSQQAETHTIAIDYRRGFSVSRFPRIEIGGQVQLHQVDGGMLNGFITGFESVWSAMTGDRSAKDYLRAQVSAPPQGTLIARDGAAIYRDAGSSSGLGDVSLAAKAVLVDGDAASNNVRVAARIGVNIAGSRQFSVGNFAGMGLSIDKKLLERLAVHGDVRATRVLDGVSQLNLPLRTMTYGFSAGPEFNLGKQTSFGVQIDGSTTPYLPTGTLAFDAAYGDMTFSLAHRYKVGSRDATMRLYARENMNLPFRVHWNADPDLVLGMAITVQ